MKKIHKKYVLVIFAVLAISLSFQAAARADSMDVVLWHDGYNVDILLGGGPDAVEKTVLTAEFSLLIAQMEQVGYCVDLYQSIDTDTYNVDLITSNFSLAYLQAAWLLHEYSPGLNEINPDYSDSSIRTIITALQIAIWETVYDTGSEDLDSGTFALQSSWVSANQAVYDLANDYLEALANADLSQEMFSGNTGVAQNDRNQDLIYGNNVSATTPEPGSLLLMGSALGFGAIFRARKKAKKTSKAD